MKRWIHASSDVKDHVLDNKTLKQWVDCFISSDDAGTSVKDAINFIEEESMTTLTSDERGYVNKRIAKSIHASTKFDYDALVVNNNYVPADEVTVGLAIDSMCYNTAKEYQLDVDEGKLSFDDAVDIVIEHLDDPGTYGLECGVDYSRSYVEKELAAYLY